MTAPTPDTEERLDYLFCECGHHEDRHYWTCDVCGHQPPYTPLGATPPQADRGLREALNTIEQDAGWLYDNVPNFSPDGVATLKDICREIAKNAAAARRDTPPAGLDVEHGRCCNCFDAPNMAAGHEHWGDEL